MVWQITVTLFCEFLWFSVFLYCKAPTTDLDQWCPLLFSSHSRTKPHFSTFEDTKYQLLGTVLWYSTIQMPRRHPNMSLVSCAPVSTWCWAVVCVCISSHHFSRMEKPILFKWGGKNILLHILLQFFQVCSQVQIHTSFLHTEYIHWLETKHVQKLSYC